MSRVSEGFSWLLVFPYAYIAFFLGSLIGANVRTPKTAAVLFWAYLVVYPVAVVVCNLLTRKMRAAGKKKRALVVSLVPYGVLAGAWVSFASFVGVLCRVFG